MRIQGKKSGFTLIEMAIVLVIIGIILAGVMKGRDIVRGSQVKQFSQGFAQKWSTIAATYYDKVGQHYIDGEDNGGTVGTFPDGQMDDILMVTATERGNALQAARDVGITPCTMIKSDLADYTAPAGPGGINCGANNYNIWERTVEGEITGNSRVAVGFYSLILNISGANSQRNLVVITNVPTDVAIGLDTLIDGQADGENGSCVLLAINGAEVTSYTDPGTAVTPQAYPSESTTDHYLVMGIILDY